jgi:hypothetical protein
MEITKISTSKAAFDKAKGGGFPEIGKLKDGTTTFRIIAGPHPIETIWYPTVIEKDGQMVQSMRTISRPPEGTILDEVVKLDEALGKRELQQAGASKDDIQKYRSALRPNRAFRFLVFDRDQDNEGTPKVRPYDFPYTVKEQLELLQNTINKKSPAYLENGLVFMFDVYISRTIESGKKAAYGTTYTTTVVLDTTPAMKQKKIPADWREWTPESGKPCPWDYTDYFTEAELQAIAEYDSDLESISKTDTPEQVVEKLQKNPIYLEAQFMYGEKKGSPMFAIFKNEEHRQALLEMSSDRIPLLTQGDVPAVEAVSEEPTKEVKSISVQSAVQAPKPASISLKDKLQAKDAEVTEIHEQASIPAPVAAPIITPKPVVKQLWTPGKK